MASQEQPRLQLVTLPTSGQPPRPWRPILLGLMRPPMPLRKTWWIGTAIASLLIRAYNARASLMVGQKTSSLSFVISKRVKTRRLWPLFEFWYSAPNINSPLKNWSKFGLKLKIWRPTISISKNCTDKNGQKMAIRHFANFIGVKIPNLVKCRLQNCQNVVKVDSLDFLSLKNPVQIWVTVHFSAWFANVSVFGTSRFFPCK